MYSVLVDLNNLLMRNTFHQETQITSENPQYSLIKFFVFDQIYWGIVKLKKWGYEISEVVLCIDDKNSWRKAYFPRYKEGRKKQEDIDWDVLFSVYNQFQKEIKDHLPFKVIKVSRCEGDDIIGSLCLGLPEQNFIVISTDSDFKQLLDKNNVLLYNPFEKDFMKCDDVYTFKQKLFLMGQSKDSILNAKTPNDYPYQLRKPPLGEKTADKIIYEGIDNFLNKEQKINKKYINENGEENQYSIEFKPIDLYNRNRALIDFECIPKVLVYKVLEVYNNYELPSPENIYEFFRKQGWNSYLDSYEISEKVLLKLYN